MAFKMNSLTFIAYFDEVEIDSFGVKKGLFFLLQYEIYPLLWGGIEGKYL